MDGGIFHFRFKETSVHNFHIIIIIIIITKHDPPSVTEPRHQQNNTNAI